MPFDPHILKFIPSLMPIPGCILTDSIMKRILDKSLSHILNAIIFQPDKLKDMGFFKTGDGGPEFKSSGSYDIKEDFKDADPFKKFSDFQKKHEKELYNDKFYYDPATGKRINVDPNDAKALEEFEKHNAGTPIPVDLKLAGVGTSGSISIWGAEGDIKGKFGGASGSIDVGKLEGNAEAYMGFLTIGASAGASFTAFSTEGKAYLGSEDTNVYVKGGISAGKVGVKADGSLGLLDKEGNFNPSAYIGASAELIGGEIEGTVGFQALGTDVGLKGSVNYGLGAHANVGMHDGKISIDIGATVGVGGSVSLEIDASGTIKAISEKADKISSGVKQIWSNIWK